MTLDEQIAYCKKKVATGSDFQAHKAILNTLLSLRAGAEELTDKPSVDGQLYKQAIAAYDTFLREQIGTGLKMNAGQGKAMKDILKYLEKESKDPSPSGVLASWEFILAKWTMQSEFIGKQVNLTQINKNLLEILSSIRNGNTKAKQQHNRREKEQLKADIRKRRSV
jgi:hypothetical protein